MILQDHDNWPLEELGSMLRGVHVVLVSLIGRPISLFFWSAERKLSRFRDRTNFFVDSLEFFVQSFLKIGHAMVTL